MNNFFQKGHENSKFIFITHRMLFLQKIIKNIVVSNWFLNQFLLAKQNGSLGDPISILPILWFYYS